MSYNNESPEPGLDETAGHDHPHGKPKTDMTRRGFLRAGGTGALVAGGLSGAGSLLVLARKPAG